MAASVSALGAALSLISLMGRYGDHIDLGDNPSVPCGQAGDQREARIIGGHDVAHGRYPWIVSLQWRGYHICGATLLSRRVIATAAHCLNDKPIAQLTVVSGEHRIQSRDGTELRHRINTVVMHPDYRYPSFANDLALLQLTAPVVWDQWRRPVCLPRPDHRLPQGSGATVAGWGWLGEQAAGGRRADQLQQVHVPLLAGDTCQLWYRLAGRQLRLRPGQMCAGVESGGRDGCGGDSGGPMVVLATSTGANSHQPSERYLQVGVVSAGVGCGRAHLPGVYTDLRQYVVWLTAQVQLLEGKLGTAGGQR